jgi:nicotinamide phosphoribosyltransferase
VDNLILMTDSYKPSHWKQYPPKTQYVRSYMAPRGGPFPHVLTFGALNVVMESYLARRVHTWMIDEAEEVITAHIGPGIFNRAGWEHIVNKHGGHLPLLLRAIPEGHFVPTGHPVLTIENTDPAVPWLTNYVETCLYPWYPYTVATLSNACRRVILRHLHATGDPSLIDFKLHDFGYRGTTEPWFSGQAAIGGLAHLVNFKGSDTIPALMMARRFYDEPMAGFSVPAAEHSTITAWKREGEGAAYRNMLDQFPTGIAAVVSDSYNIYEACEKLWGTLLHDEVLQRDGVLVVRPDSGNPAQVTRKVLEILGQRFGFTVNSKGYRVLNPHVRVLYGDGINQQSMDMILAVASINGWSADNVGFGMGGALLQGVTRDTMRWSFKACGVTVNGETYGIGKTPVDDAGKKSIVSTSGYGVETVLHVHDGQPDAADWCTVDVMDAGDYAGVMVPFFRNGQVLYRESLKTIRERVVSAETIDLPESVFVC